MVGCNYLIGNRGVLDEMAIKLPICNHLHFTSFGCSKSIPGLVNDRKRCWSDRVHEQAAEPLKMHAKSQW